MQNSASGPLDMDSAITGQQAQFSLWTSGQGFRRYRSACRTQPLDLGTWIPPLQVRMHNLASGPLVMDPPLLVSMHNIASGPRDMDSTTTGQHAEFSLWTSGHGFRHYRSACRIQPLDLWTLIPPLQVSMQNSVSGPLDMDSTTTGQHAEFSLWTSGHGSQNCRSGCRIRPLDINSATVIRHAEFSLWTSGHGFHHYRAGCRIQPLGPHRTWILTLYKAGCRIQPLDLWTCMPSSPQVRMQNSASVTSGHGF
jgi:hypothetical protein